MVDDARQHFNEALRSDDKRVHRQLSEKLATLSPSELDCCEVVSFYETLDEFDESLLVQLARHADLTAFTELTAYLITLPQAKGARDFCFARLSQSASHTSQEHSPLLLALLESDPKRASQRMDAFAQYDSALARQLRLRIAFDGLLNGGEQTQRSWHTLQNAGFHILSTPLHSDEERESLVWLRRLSDLKARPESTEVLLTEALNKTPKEQHRLLCAFVASPETHDFLTTAFPVSLPSLLHALIDTLYEETDIKHWQRHWDLARPLLRAAQAEFGAAALAPLKRMLASYSACAQRHRDPRRGREIADLLRPVALHFVQHQRPHAQSFDVRYVLQKPSSARAYLRSV